MDDELIFRSLRWLLMFFHRWLSAHGFQTRKARARASLGCDARTTEYKRGRSIGKGIWTEAWRSLKIVLITMAYAQVNSVIHKFHVSVMGHCGCESIVWNPDWLPFTGMRKFMSGYSCVRLFCNFFFIEARLPPEHHDWIVWLQLVFSWKVMKCENIHME